MGTFYLVGYTAGNDRIVWFVWLLPFRHVHFYRHVYNVSEKCYDCGPQIRDTAFRYKWNIHWLPLGGQHGQRWFARGWWRANRGQQMGVAGGILSDQGPKQYNWYSIHLTPKAVEKLTKVIGVAYVHKTDGIILHQYMNKLIWIYVTWPQLCAGSISCWSW